jgi:hypothetical protein
MQQACIPTCAITDDGIAILVDYATILRKVGLSSEQLESALINLLPAGCDECAKMITPEVFSNEIQRECVDLPGITANMRSVCMPVCFPGEFGIRTFLLIATIRQGTGTFQPDVKLALLSGGDSRTECAECARVTTQAVSGTEDSPCPSRSEWRETNGDGVFMIWAELAPATPDGEPEYVFIGTAFAVDKRKLVTNGHVAAALYDVAREESVARDIAVQGNTGTVFELRNAVFPRDYQVFRDPTSVPDIALIITGTDLPHALVLANHGLLDGLGLVDDSFIVGFPGDTLTNVRPDPLPAPIVDFDPFPGNPQPTSLADADVIQHNGATTGGTSGSPLIYCGQIIGVNNATSTDTQGNNSFAIQVDHVRTLVEDFSEGAGDLYSLPDDIEFCAYRGDGECDDGRPGAVTAVCPAGSDTADCVSVTPPPPPTPHPSESCPVTCAYCYFGTDRENNCPAEWNNDGECDCGCQFVDLDCALPPPPQPSPPPDSFSWVEWVNDTIGTRCGIVNAFDFQVVVEVGTRRILFVNGTDFVSERYTIDESGELLDQGQSTGNVVMADYDAAGQPRAWLVDSEGFLLWRDTRQAVKPSDVLDSYCDGCELVDNPAAGWCP